MKIKDLLKITGISLLGVLGVGLSIFGSAKGMTLLADNYSQASAYSVNENNDSVTFSPEELNNCSYEYLSTVLANNYDEQEGTIPLMQNSYIIYNNENWRLDDTGTYIMYTNEVDYICFNVSNTSGVIGKFIYTDDQDIESDFLYPLTIYSDFFAENMQKSVTLSASQLDNNTYEYFANYIINDSSNYFVGSYIIYNNIVYNFEEFLTYGYIKYTSNNQSIDFNLGGLEYIGNYWSLNEDLDNNFNNSITIYSTYIADNLYAPYQPVNLLTAIVGLLTGGITGIASGVGSGVSTLTTQIFISNNALSVFGGMIVVFAGLSLAIGLCRWIMQFLTSLGAKK